ncbi:hypothetical protein GOODEAATRI_017517 [Goodea atripinnis]|uniref:Uncharacterized protein n=1 Tax=Goodea atripinnis TaxID=208336 RepID=A0ABV0NXZ4_9TELE
MTQEHKFTGDLKASVTGPPDVSGLLVSTGSRTTSSHNVQSAKKLFSAQLTEVPFLNRGTLGCPARAALSPRPVNRRPAVLLPSGNQERRHPQTSADNAGHVRQERGKTERFQLNRRSPPGSRSLPQSRPESNLNLLRKHPGIPQVAAGSSAAHAWSQHQRNNNSCNLLICFKTRLKGLRVTHTPARPGLSKTINPGLRHVPTTCVLIYMNQPVFVVPFRSL